MSRVLPFLNPVQSLGLIWFASLALCVTFRLENVFLVCRTLMDRSANNVECLNVVRWLVFECSSVCRGPSRVIERKIESLTSSQYVQPTRRSVRTAPLRTKARCGGYLTCRIVAWRLSSGSWTAMLIRSLVLSLWGPEDVQIR
jgi:hypothetical protein